MSDAFGQGPARTRARVALATPTEMKYLPRLTTIATGALLVTASFVQVAPVIAQVSVAPTALFLTNQERFGAIYVSNQSATPQEVTVDFRFGYTDSDSSGTVFMQYEDAPSAERYSLASHVRAFPQQFVLPPGETQVVRLTARPPADADSGFLWTRVLTTSTPQIAFEETATTGVQTRVIFRMQQVTALFYEAGEPEVDVQIDGLKAQRDSSGVRLLATLSHQGNAPYLGSAHVRISRADGSILAEERQPIAVYNGGLRQISLEVADALEAAQVELTLSPQRTDVPARFLLSNAPVSRTASVSQ